MSKHRTTKWWKCRRTGCDFDALHSSLHDSKEISRSTHGDLAAKITQVHLLDHICDILHEPRNDDEPYLIARDAQIIAAAAVAAHLTLDHKPPSLVASDETLEPRT